MLDSLSRMRAYRTRSISSENPTGSKGGGGMATPVREPDGTWSGGVSAEKARDLGRGWKVNPYERIAPGETRQLAAIDGPGVIRHIWMTGGGPAFRNVILRFHWDDQQQPSVETPLGDFFASGYNSFARFSPINSLAVCVNPGLAFNCYWPMPFRKRCRITVENRDASASLGLYYQVDYELGPVADDEAYFHAQFRRVNPLPYGRVYTLLDGVKGRGQYVGTAMAWQVNNSGWWGEGEIKFYLDGDIPAGKPTDQAVAEHGGECFPTICGTGTEDYFCGSYNFENKGSKQYQEFTTAYAGLSQVLRPDGVYQSQTRFSLYRWHLADPIRFESDLAVTMQAIGWRADRRYLALQDDIASVAYWYQTLPTAPFPPLGDCDALEII